MEWNEFFKRAVRVLYISRKPTQEEYLKVIKITALGMLLFGFIGFLVSVLFSFI